ncbi:MAG TPA: sulfite exporter TauE/SafE family protein [Vitreimonas sp.]|uniref:sulfite exporter TauE/SafE family protein n=1 Tax=Vitreimonas sp. TaxID=3069702 RepID=UPI002D23017B|nr:sulfite exporter TauE/SafE family protein [Vitreimonas sp.]HYD86852.1 sulfite exporter TauE/SafE family protein [Vitreimonas sp.]
MEIAPDLWPVLWSTFGLFLLVGFFAQLVDGAVGMAYGVISTSVLLAFGVPPAQASATIHAAECFTTGASGASHLVHRNVDWKLFFRLAPAGVIGGVIGAYLLTGFDATFIKAVVVAYLGVLGIVMLRRALREPKEEPPHLKHVIPLGIVGGFLDASGGGGWGPVVSSTLLGRGHTPRYVIGSVNSAEFVITMAISLTFLWTLLTGRFELEGGIALGAASLSGLILGGVVAAPLAGYVTKIAPARVLLGAAAVLVMGLSIWQGIQLWPRLLEYPIFNEMAQSAGLH